MDTLILNRSLKLIEQIYDESLYGDKDIYRIKDVIHSLDANHWKSKQWAADIFFNLYLKLTKDKAGESYGGKILIVGGWYGLLAYLLRKGASGNGGLERDKFQIESSDMDPKCAEIGHKLFWDQNIGFKTFAIQDDVDYSNISAIFCTSVEHIDPKIIQNMIDKKDKNTWIVLQSTNMQHASHINTHTTYKQLEESFVFGDANPNDEEDWLEQDGKNIEYSNSQNLGGGLVRHMVIAR